MKNDFYKTLDAIYESDPRYRQDAYEFIMEALTFTQKKFKRIKHVTGEELLEGAKELLMEKYGPLTLLVLKHWGIKTTEDFGNIVFNLVNSKILSKTQDDRMENFRDGYDFKEVFEKGYRNKLLKTVRRLR